eukprot:TRINITY_DN13101_c0_g1_i3.p1 TRINITY_DN13101_c0_g1~~TRINITY_DN13101_c0_g1_i3.p1  ORF type:complete len:680 (-),score=206.24 TRINITY_DN13101_c0_g1_i3:794-2833(-)
MGDDDMATSSASFSSASAWLGPLPESPQVQNIEVAAATQKLAPNARPPPKAKAASGRRQRAWVRPAGRIGAEGEVLPAPGLVDAPSTEASEASQRRIQPPPGKWFSEKQVDPVAQQEAWQNWAWQYAQMEAQSQQYFDGQQYWDASWTQESEDAWAGNADGWYLDTFQEAAYDEFHQTVEDSWQNFVPCAAALAASCDSTYTAKVAVETQAEEQHTETATSEAGKDRADELLLAALLASAVGEAAEGSVASPEEDAQKPDQTEDREKEGTEKCDLEEHNKDSVPRVDEDGEDLPDEKIHESGLPEEIRAERAEVVQSQIVKEDAKQNGTVVVEAPASMPKEKEEQRSLDDNAQNVSMTEDREKEGTEKCDLEEHNKDSVPRVDEDGEDLPDEKIHESGLPEEIRAERAEVVQSQIVKEDAKQNGTVVVEAPASMPKEKEEQRSLDDNAQNVSMPQMSWADRIRSSNRARQGTESPGSKSPQAPTAKAADNREAVDAVVNVASAAQTANSLAEDTGKEPSIELPTEAATPAVGLASLEDVVISSTVGLADAVNVKVGSHVLPPAPNRPAPAPPAGEDVRISAEAALRDIQAENSPPLLPAASPLEATRLPTAKPAATPAEATKSPALKPAATPAEVTKSPALKPAATPAEVTKSPALKPAATPAEATKSPALKPATPAEA